MNNEPTPEELGVIRYGAQIAALKPYMDAEIDTLQKSVVNSVISAVNSNTLTADIALSKWHEYLAYSKIGRRLGQRTRTAEDVSKSVTLDISNKIV